MCQIDANDPSPEIRQDGRNGQCGRFPYGLALELQRCTRASEGGHWLVSNLTASVTLVAGSAEAWHQATGICYAPTPDRPCTHTLRKPRNSQGRISRLQRSRSGHKNLCYPCRIRSHRTDTNSRRRTSYIGTLQWRHHPRTAMRVGPVRPRNYPTLARRLSRVSFAGGKR